MHTLQQALDKLFANFSAQAEVFSSPLDKAYNLVLAEDIESAIAVPSFDNSAMDGYAFQLSDHQSEPLTLEVASRIQAGDAVSTLAADSAARIFTGAAIPNNANTVVIQENCKADGKRVQILKLPQLGANIRRSGEDIKPQQPVVASGSVLDAAKIGLLASIGVAQCLVYRPLRVALLSTGNELIAPGEVLHSGQLYNSNSFVLQALNQRLNYEVVSCTHVVDDYQSTKQTVVQLAEQADVIISSGGVSVGEEDYVKKVLDELGNIDLWKIAMKPGKPLVAGKLAINDRAVAWFGLPGNPVSAYITFNMVVKPVLANMQGATYKQPVCYCVESAFERSGGSRLEFVRVSIVSDDHTTKVIAHPNQSSGVMSSIAESDGVIMQHIGQDIKIGSTLQYLPFG